MMAAMKDPDFPPFLTVAIKVEQAEVLISIPVGAAEAGGE
jgi:hypothetical protein